MRSTHRRNWVLAAAAVAALGVALAVAELADVYLKNGLRLRGDVMVTPTEVVVRNELGEARFAKDQVERVVPLAESRPAPVSQPVSQPAAEPTEATTTQPSTSPSEPESGLIREGNPPVPTSLPAPPSLSALDIQRLKVSELRLDPPAERVRVKFAGKDALELPRKVVEDLSQRPDFRKDWEQTLLHGPAADKLQLMVRLTGTKYADRITIGDDPAVFAEYRTRVLPVIVSNCARAGCHAGNDSVAFRFPSGITTSEGYAYTTFVLLDRTQTPQGPLLDRRDPENSALLGYLLPEKENPRAHPALEGRRRLSFLLHGKENPAYKRIDAWIESLAKPHPRYGLDYAFVPEPAASQPVENPPAQTQPVATQPAQTPPGPAPPGSRPSDAQP